MWKYQLFPSASAGLAAADPLVSMVVSGKVAAELLHSYEYPATPLPLPSEAPVHSTVTVLSFDQALKEWLGLETLGLLGAIASYFKVKTVTQAEAHPALSSVRARR